MTTSSGEERILTHHHAVGEKDPVGWGQSDTTDILFRFVRSKLNPAIGVVLDLRSGEDMVGNPVDIKNDPLGVMERLLLPLSVQGTIEAVEEHGWSRGAALGVMEALGESVQIYGPGVGKGSKGGEGMGDRVDMMIGPPRRAPASGGR